MEESNGGQGDRLSQALKRAENAIRGQQEKELELELEKERKLVQPKAAAPANNNTGFGEIDLGGGDSGDLDLAEAPAAAEASVESEPAPAPRKPVIKKPSIMQDEVWDDPEEQLASPPSPQPAPAARQAAPAQPAPQKVRRVDPNKAPPDEPIAEPAPEPEAPPQAGPFVRVTMASKPSRDWGKAIKIMLIVVVALGVIGGGIFGYMKWQDSKKADEQAHLDSLNQVSLDSLKNDAVKKDY